MNEVEEELTKYRFPDGWAWAKIGDICLTTSGGTPSRRNLNYYRGDIPWVKSGELNYGTIQDTEESITLEALENSNAKLIPKGSLLIALYGSTVGKLSFLGREAATNQAVASITTFAGFSNKYLFHFLYHNREKILKQRVGGAQPNISQNILKNITLPIPPLNEQVRIVSKLEELFSELDHSIENLELASAQLKVYRKVILQQAFEGKLTENWRNENKHEPVNGQLKKIKKEVQVWYEQEVEDWKKELLEWEKKEKDGVRPFKPRAKKDPYILGSEDQTDLPILPDGWDWTTLESFTAITGGVTKGKRYGNIDTIELPYLSVANVQDGYFDLSQIKNIPIAHNELKKYQLKYGDILYAEGGDKDKVGRGAMWRGEIKDCIHQNHVFRARVLSNEVNPVFCALFSRTKVAKDYFYRNAKQTTNLASINLTVLSRLPFPLPSRAEQDLIVETIESRFSLIENLEKALNAGLRECQSLKHSILKMAFQGNLVPQDSSDIPANELLAQIATERKEFLIAEKQRRASFKPTDKSRRKMAKQLKEIIDLLNENSEPIRTKDLWEDSIYKNDIDAFYAELKELLEEGIIVELPRQGRESYIKLADKK